MHKHFVSLLSHVSLSLVWIFHRGEVFCSLSSFIPSLSVRTSAVRTMVQRGHIQSYNLPDWSSVFQSCKMLEDLSFKDLGWFRVLFLPPPLIQNTDYSWLWVWIYLMCFQANCYSRRLIHLWNCRHCAVKETSFQNCPLVIYCVPDTAHACGYSVLPQQIQALVNVIIHFLDESSVSISALPHMMFQPDLRIDCRAYWGKHTKSCQTCSSFVWFM